MASSIKKVQRILFMQWGDMIQYRLDLVLWTIAEVATPLLSLAVWYTVSGSQTDGPGQSEVLAYYVAFMFTATLVTTWHSFPLSSMILNGDIVKHLVRPFPPIWQLIANNIVEKSIRVPTLLIIFLMAFIVIPTAFERIISQLEHSTLYLVSVVLAITISFSLKSILGFLAFWLEEAGEIIRYQFLFETIASGMLIPYAFMPSTISSALSLLPFRYIYSTPVEILIGQVNTSQITSLLLIQGVWAIVLTFLSVFIWRRGLKRYAVPGQ